MRGWGKLRPLFNWRLHVSKSEKKPAKFKVAKDGAVHDGKGGYMKKGDELPASADIEGLKAKGLAE